MDKCVSCGHVLEGVRELALSLTTPSDGILRISCAEDVTVCQKCQKENREERVDLRGKQVLIPVGLAERLQLFTPPLPCVFLSDVSEDDLQRVEEQAA